MDAMDSDAPPAPARPGDMAPLQGRLGPSAAEEQLARRSLVLQAADGFALALSALELAKLADAPHTYRLPPEGPAWQDLRDGRNLPRLASGLFAPAFARAVAGCLDPDRPLAQRADVAAMRARFAQLRDDARAEALTGCESGSDQDMSDVDLRRRGRELHPLHISSPGLSSPSSSSSLSHRGEGVAAQQHEVTDLRARVRDLEAMLAHYQHR